MSLCVLDAGALLFHKMLTAVASFGLAWTASPLPPPQHQLNHFSRRAPIAIMDGAPTLREQMKAYLKSVQERGVELTPEQKQMIAEMKADDELLDQSGRVDFMKGAEVLSPEEYAARESAGEAVPDAVAAPPAALAAAPAAVAAPPAAVAAPAPTTYMPPTGAAAAPVYAPVAAPVVPDSPVDPQTARMWAMQAAELETAVGLLGLMTTPGGGLDAAQVFQLRKSLSSLIYTLSSAPMIM